MTIDSFRGENRWLSNFGDNEAAYDGVVYPTSEHAYMAAKTLNPEERAKILACPTPGKAKRLGRKVTLRKGWDDIKVSIMEGIINDKYERSPELQAKLIATGDEKLVEGNDWGDTFWGVCKGQGKNHLGRILMRVRDRLRYA
jgi:ribA/ribD-fused uncharacterized protein